MLLPRTPPLSTPTTTTLPPHHTPPTLAARSAITLYPSAPASPSTITESPQPTTNTQPLTSPYPHSQGLPPAFWAVFGCLLGLIMLLLITWPFIYHYYHLRHCPNAQKSSHPIITVTPPPPPPETHQQQQQQQQQLPQWWGISPLAQQQFSTLQAASAANNSNPHTPSTFNNPYYSHHHHQPVMQSPGLSPADPNTTTLISRLRQLNNPSILGAIPESTVMTVPSRVMGGTNAHWRGLAERRLQEARVRGEVVAEEEGGGGDRDGSCVVERGDGGKEGGGEKRVRWREREWAVLAGSESGVGSVGGGKV